MPATIRVKSNKLSKLAISMPEKVSRTLRRGTMATLAGAIGRAPVRTGYLRASIFADGATPGSLSMTVGVAAEYAPHQEFGTRTLAPKAFMRKTVAQTFPATEAELKNLEPGL